MINDPIAGKFDVYEGRADFSLTERGHRQAQAMAGFVADNNIIANIYASTLKRASQTAVHLAEVVGIGRSQRNCNNP